MNDSINALDGFVKGSGSSDVRYDGESESACVATLEVRVCFADCFSSGLAANGATNFVTVVVGACSERGQPRSLRHQ